MVQLLIFCGAHSPLPVRYPHPPKPVLALPPLVHRSLHTALDVQPPSIAYDHDCLVIPHPSALVVHPPSEDYEVTVKIQITSGEPATYAATVRDALATLGQRKGVAKVDVVLIGLPMATSEQDWENVWSQLDSLGCAVNSWGTIGLLEPMLSKLSATRTPYVNELNVTDCHTLPGEYTSFAKSKGIHLWASGGKTGNDPLPATELHNLLQEFQPKLQKILGKDLPIRNLVGVTQDGGDYDCSQPASVATNWVVTYTLLSRTRNIVKDKGYIVCATLP